MERQVQTRQRVIDHGEVYTREREVCAMLDLVKHETERIDSRFFEPACGTGNFLAEVLRRKLRVVENRYRRSPLEYERNAVLAVSSVYGIDILWDNISHCRQRLLGLFDDSHTHLFKSPPRQACLESVRYILSQNIVVGDALTFETVGDLVYPKRAIELPEWSAVNGSLLKRRDFIFRELVAGKGDGGPTLFSDEGEDAFIPEPVRDYPLVHYLKVADAQGREPQPRCVELSGQPQQR